MVRRAILHNMDWMPVRGIVLILGVVGGPWTAHAGDVQKARVIYSQGTQHYDLGEYEE